MEQDAATQAAGSPNAPGTAGNGGGGTQTTGPNSGSTDASTTTGTTPPTDPWRQHFPDAQSLEDAGQRYKRYQEQIRGSQTEAQRLKSETERLQRERDDYATRYQQVQPLLLNLAGVQGQGPGQTRQPITLQAAMDAAITGDTATVQAYEQQQHGQQYLTPEQADQRFVHLMTSMAKPYQVGEWVSGQYPDLKKTESPLYKAVYDSYDDLANHPAVKLMFPEDPLMVQPQRSPDGFGSKPMDLRVMAYAAGLANSQLAREQGRVDEHQRNRAGTVEGGQQGGPPADQDSPLITADERRFIRDNLRSLPPEWGSTEDAVIKHKWEKLMTPAEKARRKAAKAAGTWAA